MSEERLRKLQHLAAQKPSDSRLQFGLAVEYLNQGRTREGVDALRAYLRLAEDQGNAWSRLGAALAELGDLEEAREAYRKGLDAATRYGHDAMIEEMEEALEDLG